MSPETDTTRSAYGVCRIAVAFVWLYHGLVPKLLGPHADEIAINLALGFSPQGAQTLAFVAGLLEIAMAAAVLLFWRQRWPLVVTAVAMVVLALVAAIVLPGLLAAAFNPVTTNACALALCIAALKLQPAPRP